MDPDAPRTTPIVALAGGVGAARFLSGLVRAVAPEDVTAIVNTGDDCVFYGVHVSPDVDIVTYALAGRIDRARGYGLEGDTTAVIETLGALGHETWFRLGDRDFAHCQHRSCRLAQGVGLAAIADELRRALGVATRILPMSEAPCPTIVELSGRRRVHFEEYLARDGAPDDVEGVDLSAARAAAAAPGVLEAIAAARVILLCPSNPVVSIGPILAVQGVREALREARAPRVAVSPIVGGVPVKGPADRLLRGLGIEVSARGVARLYADLLDGFVLDQRDAAQAAEIEALGMRVCAVDTLMRTPDLATALARTALALARTAR
ncbi:MAG: 2-phospho-L-lactate transferase [Myxococcales bacterium]|nr:2-phospho-L-lactate transferase [Myxococcales bacterium]MDH5566950.1 2-phospho-L-lactate transferase [Myxococcales bacterium]